ncbi:MAG: twin-arginine translocase TatA/TatE family subunit [Acidimicrobiia bacterium]|nr:twin-arginine translocase TatA/TatE family subunit [Acidimicrobiia bacterium]
MGIGPTELLIVLAIVFLLFGATRLPKLARSLGQASKEFKKGVNDADHDDAVPGPNPDEKVNMTHAELDALLAEREARARKDAPPTN